MKHLRALLALSIGSAVFAGCAHSATRAGLDEALAKLRAGGNIIVMRHATSPSHQIAAIGMTDGCVLQPGRGLDSQGFAEARLIGEWFAENKVTVGKAYTSDMCRAWDTARLVAAAGDAPVIPRTELKSDDPVVAEAFKAELIAEFAASPRANVVLVTHSNITPLYWSAPLAGEDETPSGRLHFIRIELRNGSGDPQITVMRIDLNPSLSTAPSIVE